MKELSELFVCLSELITRLVSLLDEIEYIAIKRSTKK